MLPCRRRFDLLLGLILATACAAATVARAEPPVQAPVAKDAIVFTEETLPNGLRVIYAPLHQAPVVHVRVLYHVGSRDERPDRQGFAHMFEHMMFRGSAHVAPQEHMHLVDSVGGICNAYTSFDQTVYHDTVPSEYLPMALYLEADRMASFKVNADIYKTERKVVAEEWRIKQNRPYGDLYENLARIAFTTHSYRWTPIGNMEHLLSAPVSELQDFFNTYYVPNNAVLVIAGDFDPAIAAKTVNQYFSWIPRGSDIQRSAVAEPTQTQPRGVVLHERVPLTAVILGWHIPPYRSDEQYPLSVLSAVLGEGSSSRLAKLLVNGLNPTCNLVSALYEPLEDGGLFGATAMVMTGKNADAVEKTLRDAIADIVAGGITPEELAKAKTLRRVEMIHQRQTASDIASDLGDEALIGGQANRVNQDLAKLDAVSAADVQAVASKYLLPQAMTNLRMVPDPLGTASRQSAADAAAAIGKSDAPVNAGTQPVKPRDISFPADFPAQPPVPAPASSASFDKGDASEINGMKVIVFSNSRLPLVHWNLTVRSGSHSDPVGKQGLASLTADMLKRGNGEQSYQQINEELESHGISLAASEGGDYSRISGSCPTEQLELAMSRTRDLLRDPRFPAEEFKKLQAQAIDSLAAWLESPGSVADREVTTALFDGSVLGRLTTPATLAAITLDDVRQAYARIYRPDSAILTISGDVSRERALELAHKLLDGWTPQPAEAVDYQLAPPPAQRPIIVVDRPGGRGATLRMAIRTYDIHDEQKFAGSLAGTILSAGIESRLNRYVRAERGLVYGVFGFFQPTRHGGSFVVNTDTKIETAADTVEAIFKVLDEMKQKPVSDEELAEAKRRVVGSLVMRMQTIQQQADMRVDALLNDYPIDYFDVYPQRVAKVTAADIQNVLNSYIKDEAMAIIVVAPAAAVKEQLSKMGTVQVLPMPTKRPAVMPAGTQPSAGEMLK